MRNNWKLVFFLSGIVCLFLFTRLYRIPQTLEFFADLARDHSVLQMMQITRKPTLLGPSTSALPVNQSPLYFYLMFPVFLVSNGSPYTSIITLVIVHLAFLCIGTCVYRKNPKALLTLFLVSVLITLHPQYIEQHRSPWNPSFVSAFLLIAVFSLLFDTGKKRIRIFACTFGIMMAIGFSYSVLPTALILGIYGLYTFRNHYKWYLTSFVISSLFVFFPMLVFEIKHNFFFLNRLTMGHLQESNTPVSLSTKMSDLFFYVLGVSVNSKESIILTLTIISAFMYSYYQREKEKGIQKYQTSFLLVLLSSILTIITPFAVLSHYVYGISVLAFTTISSMKKWFMIPIVVTLLLVWMQPNTWAATIWRPQRRSTTDLFVCAQTVCDHEKEPMYVTVSAWHDFHYAPDHLFFFNKAGCSARDITQHPGFAKKMAVVVDQSTFEFGKSSFNELTLFGNATVSARFTCPANMQVVLLESQEK